MIELGGACIVMALSTTRGLPPMPDFQALAVLRVPGSPRTVAPDPTIGPESSLISPGMLQDHAAPSAASPEHLDPGAPSVEPFGTKGTWRWTIQGAGGFEFDDDSNAFGLVGFGVSYFVVDDVSLDGELNGMFFSQAGDQDPAGLNANLLLRWHFFTRDTWSIYVDGGAGLLVTTDDVPDGASSFNFTPQIGLGASVELNDRTRLMTGVRLHHLSNANTDRNNPGRDSLLGYVGLSIAF